MINKSTVNRFSKSILKEKVVKQDIKSFKRGDDFELTEKNEYYFEHKHRFLNDHDIFLFKEGSHFRLYEKMGAYETTVNGVKGTHFAVWAPNAEAVSVIGNFNYWGAASNPLYSRWDSSGIWEGFVPGIGHGELYKYSIITRGNHQRLEKKDPFGFHSEVPPCTASVVWNLDYKWEDQQWMKKRHQHNSLDKPMSVYEMHLGSWKRGVEDGNRCLTYKEIAATLVEYLTHMGYTHVEFMPVMSHPFSGSWGYQLDGYFSPASVYGNPEDLMYLIDKLHQADIGVILDWVPSHFPNDGHGLNCFDGTCLYEHSDEKQGYHPDWKSSIFNYGRHEVINFLISSALFWLDKYHVDGLRVDGVASMLYLDYSRNEGEWVPNQYGGRENIEAVHFLRRFNEAVYANYPDTQTIAEESTSWPQVSRPTYLGGLGFGMKWNMGWMHDTLRYFAKDPIYRKHHQNDLTFSLLYAFHENFMLSISHDEVVHGKCSLLSKMPGDDWQKFANMRLLFGYMFGHPGKKLNFMGSEFGQWSEWNYKNSIDWHLLDYDRHQNLHKWVRDLNMFYRQHPALYHDDFSYGGFEWIDCCDWQNSVFVFMRKNGKTKENIVVVCNFTPVPRHNYRVGVPFGGVWRELLNSDAVEYGGGGVGNLGEVEAMPVPYHGKYYSVSLTLPPLGVIFLKNDQEG